MTSETSDATTIDYLDYCYEIARHEPSGNVYLLCSSSLWNPAGDCVGWTYTACIGPLYYRDWMESDEQPGVARADWLEWARSVFMNQDLTQLEQDAAWANTQTWTRIVAQF